MRLFFLIIDSAGGEVNQKRKKAKTISHRGHRVHRAAEPQPNILTTEGTEIAEKLDIKANKIINIANACYKMLAKISRLCNRVVQSQIQKIFR